MRPAMTLLITSSHLARIIKFASLSRGVGCKLTITTQIRFLDLNGKLAAGSTCKDDPNTMHNSDPLK